MRTKLEFYLGQKKEFSAVLSMTCICNRNDYALLRNVRDKNGQFLTDHVWVQLTNEMNREPLGKEIRFIAEVGKYIKACGDLDFCLEGVLLLD